MVIATINTDAGFLPDHKIGAYAYWIRCGSYFNQCSGVFKEKCANVQDAEMKAVINAMHILEVSTLKPEMIIVNRDNINVSLKTKPGVKFTDLQRKLNKIVIRIRERSIPGDHPSKYKGHKYIEFRHVKAHTKVDSKRSYVNYWCDKRCREELKKWKAENLKK